MNVQLDGGYYNSTRKSPYYTNAFGDATNLPSVLPLDSIPTVQGLISSGKNEIMATAPVVDKTNDYRLTGRTIIRPAKGLTVTGEYTIDNLGYQETAYDKKVGGFLDPYGYTTKTIGNDQYGKYDSSATYQALNLFATYLRSFGDHNFTLMGGFNQEQGHLEMQSATSSGMLNADQPSLGGTTGLIPPVVADNYIDYSSRGVFGRFNYDYQGKYLIQANGRYDGSSKFPSGHQWGFFPSVSAGWRISEEQFMDFLKPYVTELKFRGSLGTVGNQNVANYAFYPGMTAYFPNWLSNFNRIATLTAPTLAADNFTWETVQTRDLGVDWGFLRNRLTGTFDWYQRDTKGILTSNPTPLPATLGTGAPVQNAGALQTKGLEVAVNWKDKIGQVSYYIGANVYDYQSVVTNAENPTKAISNSVGNLLYTGKKMGEIWGYEFDRFYTVNDFVPGSLNSSLRGGTLLPNIAKQNGQAPNPGDILYKDPSKTGAITSGANVVGNSGDMRVIGNSTPRYQFGMTGGVSYKNFDFSFVLSGVGKQQLWANNTLTFPNQWLTYGALFKNETNYWTPTNLNAHYGRIYTDAVNSPNQGYNQIVSNRFLQNGQYLRVRNVTLRYSLPKGVLQQVRVSKLSVFASCENLLTLSHMPSGMDPDVAVQGGTVGGGLGYPFMRKMSVGLNMSF
jgi:TonB-linked SusC/RagA family outer membrane protein